MLVQSAALRRVGQSFLVRSRNEILRAFHASGIVGADALDMVDTFARRHCKCLRKYMTNVGLCNKLYRESYIISFIIIHGLSASFVFTFPFQ